MWTAIAPFFEACTVRDRQEIADHTDGKISRKAPQKLLRRATSRRMGSAGRHESFSVPRANSLPDSFYRPAAASLPDGMRTQFEQCAPDWSFTQVERQRTWTPCSADSAASISGLPEVPEVDEPNDCVDSQHDDGYNGHQPTSSVHDLNCAVDQKSLW